MRRYVPILIAGAAFIAAACRESIAPTRSVGLTTIGAPVAYSYAAPVDIKSKSVTFELDPAGGRVKVGDFTLDYPANAVCDPATSGYGEDTWELPCETLNGPITITATYWWVNKTSFVDFQPDIRFSPEKEVFISTKRGAKKAEDLDAFTMYYFKSVGSTWYFYNDGSVDQTVATQRDFDTKRVWRRVKHFSGISLSSGMICDETVGDPDCTGLDFEFSFF
jgi:hypothetical protein